MFLDLLTGAQRDPAGCVIKVGVAKLEIADLYPFLTEVKVECSRTDAWTATIHFETRRDEKGMWAVQDLGLLKPWEPIVIEASFGTRTEEIMRGYIRQIKASYPQDAGAAAVIVECQDNSIVMDRMHYRQSWGTAEAPMTDEGLIFQQMVARSQLTPDPQSGRGLSRVHLFQDGTDITFLRDRAEINGYELIFAGGLVYFGPMRLSGQPQATIKVYAGLDTNCLSFDLDADGHQPDKAGYDAAPETGTTTVSGTVAPNIVLLGPESAAGGGPGLVDFVWRLRRTGTNDEAELNARAQAKANEQAMRVKVEGELDGTLYAHVLQVGKLVPVDGVGGQFNGLYYVDTVSHRFSVDGYRQSFKLMRNAYGDNVPAALPGGLSAAVSASFSLSF